MEYSLSILIHPACLLQLLFHCGGESQSSCESQKGPALTACFPRVLPGLEMKVHEFSVCYDKTRLRFLS